MAQFYCPDCDCTVTTETAATLPGCILLSQNGSETGIGGGGTSPVADPDDTGTGNGATSGNSPIGIAPFGLGIGDFFKDVCKWLPDGLCDLVKKIIVILIVVVLVIAAMKVYKTFKK